MTEMDLHITPANTIDVGLVPRRTWTADLDREVLYMSDGAADWVAIPEEHYLRGAWDLDLADPRAIADFVSAWGLPLPGDLAGATTAEIVERLAHIRNLVLCWDHLTGGRDLASVGAQWNGPDAPATTVDAASRLESLTAALKDHSPIVSVSAEGATYRTNLYAALCAQLFNHIVEGKGYLRCADPKCGRLFVRHLNRDGVPGPEKKTVRFCSQHCQDRYFNEEYRRRQRVAKLQQQGLDSYQIAKKMGRAESDVLRWMEHLEDQ